MDYEKILKRSWEITKTKKLLWVFGMVLATLSGGSANFNLNFPSNVFQKDGAEKIFKIPQHSPVESLSEHSTQILGITTNSISEYISHIPIHIWIILAISFFALIFFWLIVSLFIREWARGALISSIHDVEDQKVISLREGSKYGLSFVRKYIVLHIVPGLMFALAVMIPTALFIGILMIIESSILKTLLSIFTGIFIFIFAIVGGVLLELTIILSEQLIVRKNIKVKEALKNGFSLAKKYFLQMIVMAAIHLGIGCAVGCLSIIIIILVVIGVIVTFAFSKQLGLYALLFITIPIFIFIFLATLIRGIFLVFKTSNWTLMMREIELLEKTQDK